MTERQKYDDYDPRMVVSVEFTKEVLDSLVARWNLAKLPLFDREGWVILRVVDWGNDDYSPVVALEATWHLDEEAVAQRSEP